MIAHRILNGYFLGALSFVLLAGCSDDGNSSTAGAAGAASVAPTPSAEPDVPNPKAPCIAPPSQTVELAQNFYHSGFEITLSDAEYTPASDGCRGELVIPAVFRNRGGTLGTPNSSMLVTAGGKDYSLTERAEDLPLVPATRTGKGFLRFAVGSGFDPDQASLIVGDGNEHRATVPIGTNAEEVPHTLEPADIQLTDAVKAGPLTFQMEGGFIRADEPSDHQTFSKNHLGLILDFSVAATSSQNVLPDHFTLLLPDGTAIAPDFAPIELTRAGATIPDLSVGFLIGAPPEGKYTLEFGGAWGPHNEWARGAVSFVVAAQPQFD